MAQQTYTKAEKYAEWELLGEDAVRTLYNTGKFGDVGDKRALAKMWLDERDQGRKLSSQAESLAIAASAKDAAWVAAEAAREAAREAKTANIIASLALAGAAIAIAISIVAAFLR